MSKTVKKTVKRAVKKTVENREEGHLGDDPCAEMPIKSPAVLYPSDLPPHPSDLLHQFVDACPVTSAYRGGATLASACARAMMKRVGEPPSERWTLVLVCTAIATFVSGKYITSVR